MNKLFLTVCCLFVSSMCACPAPMAAEEWPQPGPPPHPPEGMDGNQARPWGWPATKPVVEGLEQVDALDAVTLALAHTYVGKQQCDKAIGLLEELGKTSPDATARGYAHLALARIHKQNGNVDLMTAELKLVCGPACANALTMMLEAAGTKEAEQIAKLEDIVKSVDDPVMKSMALRRLCQFYDNVGNIEKLAALKEQSPSLLSRKEARDALEIEQKTSRQGSFRPRMMPGGPGGGRKGHGNSKYPRTSPQRQRTSSRELSP